MADLCAERIIKAVAALLKGSADPRPTSAGVNVFEHRVDELYDDEGVQTVEIPALGVWQDADASLPGDNGRYRTNVAVMDSMLSVRIQAADRGNTEAAVRASLNQLRKEVHALMMPHDALGLPFVLDVLPIGAEQPEMRGEADKISGAMEIAFDVHYRYNVNDASAGVGE